MDEMIDIVVDKGNDDNMTPTTRDVPDDAANCVDENACQELSSTFSTLLRVPPSEIAIQDSEMNVGSSKKQVLQAQEEEIERRIPIGEDDSVCMSQDKERATAPAPQELPESKSVEVIDLASSETNIEEDGDGQQRLDMVIESVEDDDNQENKEERKRPARHPEKYAWETFAKQEHSLRISASDVAAVAGYHPFKSLPKVLMDHVYQGYWGQMLLKHDAKNLGIQLVSDDEFLMELAIKAGSSTTKAMKEAFDVKSGVKKLPTVETATKLKQKVLEEAKKSNKLSQSQLKQLQDGAQHSINTGFGTAWEDLALDEYERQCGYEVDERNCEVRTWPFARLDIFEGEMEQQQQPTVVPIEPAYTYYSRVPKSRKEDSITTITDDKPAVTSPTPCLSTNASKRQKIDTASNVLVTNESKEEKRSEEAETCKLASSIPDSKAADISMTSTASGEVEMSISKDSDDSHMHGVDLVDSPSPSNDANVARQESPTTTMQSQERSKPPPFFSIRGSVDGIRDELAPNNRVDTRNGANDANDDDSWILRKIVVECKHRMKRIQPTPPLYEQIQATVYCLMYDVDHVDLVQVLRQSQTGRPKTSQYPTKEAEMRSEGRVAATSQNEGFEAPAQAQFNAPSAGEETDSNMANETPVPPNGLLTSYFPRKDQTSGRDEAALTVANVDNQGVNGGPDMAEPTQGDVGKMEAKHTDKLTFPGTEAANDEPVDQINSAPNVDPDVHDEPNTESKESNNHQDPPTNQSEDVEMNTTSKSKPQLEISVNRISLNDPILQHGTNWNTMILPRLRSWVDAVYSIRQDEYKRQSLLLNCCDNNNDNNDPVQLAMAWELLFDECPWLRHCDTGYKRDISSSS